MSTALALLTAVDASWNAGEVPPGAERPAQVVATFAKEVSDVVWAE